ncbi:MAG: acyl transferase/acyl hydrolase/lysophospholipase [Benniella sp.]|nr:MAG: acyl transferase/acyl hydrolase/lysophospholipase [Benniella sp.]
MMYLLRSGLLRNLGGITDPRLFCHSFLGTKHLIESYMDEVVSQLEHVAEAGHTTLSRQAKIDFFMETRQSFGSSALLLHGGASFGMYHLGVVKTLFENGLLPRIISGASVGALVAAMVCVKTDEELPSIFEEGGIDLSAFQRVGARGSLSRKFTRLMTEGYLIDIKVLQNCIQTNVGNLTFDEAFKRTKRVLNITVPSSRKSEGPQLLNYITSPNVLISSAACTSISMLGFSSVADLLAKDNSGNIIRWTPSASNYTNPITPSFFSYGVVSPETPLTRLSELFNVNHFIVSQANPYIVPFMSRGLKNRRTGFDRFSAGLMERIARVILAELTHRMGQMNQIGILPHFFVQLVEEKVSGNVTMVPEVRMQDFLTLISNPTHKSIQYWVLKGEQSAWPFLPMLKYRLMIELALDRILLQLRAEASASALQAGIDGQHYPTGARHHRRQKSGPKRLTPHSTSPTVVRRGSGTNIGSTGGQGAAAQQRMKMTSQAGQADQDYLTVDPYQNGYHPTQSRHDHQQHSNGTMDDLEDDLDAPDAGLPVPFSDPKRSKSMC